MGTGVRTAVGAVRGQKGAEEKSAEAVLSWAAGLFLTASVLLLLYTVNCGINYRRISFSEKSGIVTEDYDVEVLKRTCEWLTDEVNVRADMVGRNADGEMVLESAEGSDAVLAMEELAEAVEADLRANTRFWNAYEGAVAEVSNQVNDTYLKANGQSDGVQSYSRMVDLLAAYYQGM